MSARTAVIATDSLRVQPPRIAICDACGCAWRDNGDGTMSLGGQHERSCSKCEPAGFDRLLAPRFSLGQWVRFTHQGALVIGVVQHIRRASSWYRDKFVYVTDQGDVTESHVLEAR